MNLARSTICLVCLAAVTGCAEGPFWQMGKYSPWVRDKWAAEEEIADTLFKTKREMRELAENSRDGNAKQRDEAASKLAARATTDKVLLTRLQAIEMLSQIDSPVALDALTQLATDPNPDVRLKVVQAWKRKPGTKSVPALRQILAQDTNVDVRLAATRALGEFPGEESIRALNLALTDRDPAIQLRATESLTKATGQSLGRDVAAWQQFVSQTVGEPNKELTAESKSKLQR